MFKFAIAILLGASSVEGVKLRQKAASDPVADQILGLAQAKYPQIQDLDGDGEICWGDYSEYILSRYQEYYPDYRASDIPAKTWQRFRDGFNANAGPDGCMSLDEFDAAVGLAKKGGAHAQQSQQ